MENNNNTPVFETGEVKQENVYGSCKRCGKPIPSGMEYCDDCLKEIDNDKIKAKSKKKVAIIVVIVAIVLAATCIFMFSNNKGKNTWVTDSDGVDHYYDNKGKMAINTFINANNKTYYVDGDGKKVVDDFVEKGDKCYYFNLEGIRVEKDWVKKDDKYYYFAEDGNMIKDKWEKINEKWYVLDKDGAMLANTWQNGDDGLLYYIGPDGTMQQDTMCDIGGIMFYFDENGIMKVNTLVTVDGAIYYANANGMIEKNKWVANNTYYAGEDGKILINTITPDGVEVDATGKRKVPVGGWSSPEQPSKPYTPPTQKDPDVDKSKGVWIQGYNSFSDTIEFDDETYVDVVIKYPIFGAQNSDEAAAMNACLDSCRDDMLSIADEKINEEEKPKNYKITTANIANIESNKITVIMKGKMERSGKSAKDVLIRYIYDRSSGTGFVRN